MPVICAPIYTWRAAEFARCRPYCLMFTLPDVYALCAIFQHARLPVVHEPRRLLTRYVPFLRKL